jgi:hypothetical protein
MNSPCDFRETRHDVGLACENDRRLVTRMSKRPTQGASLMSNKIKSPTQKQGNRVNSPCIPALPRVGHMAPYFSISRNIEEHNIEDNYTAVFQNLVKPSLKSSSTILCKSATTG